MKIAIVGSRNLIINDLEKYIPPEVSEIVTGGARGIDSCAEKYAVENKIKLTVFLPDYKKHGRYAAPLKRNLQIIEYSDLVIAFWDNTSRGTKFVIDNCKRLKREHIVHIIPKKE